MLDIAKICRLCLNEFHHLHNVGSDIAEILNQLLKIQLNPMSRVPYKICIDCIHRVMDFKQFFQTVSENQVRLLDILLSQPMEVSSTTTTTSTLSPLAITIPDDAIKVACEVEVMNDEEPANRGLNQPFNSADNYMCYPQMDQLPILSDFYQLEQETVTSLPAADPMNLLQLFPNQEMLFNSFDEKQDDSDYAFDPSPSSSVTYSQTTATQYSFVSSQKTETSPVSVASLGLEHDLQEVSASSQIDFPSPFIDYQGKTSNDRPRFQCKICGVWVLNILQHQRCVHVTEKDQACGYCNRIFPNGLKLMMHINYKHKPPKFNCAICAKPFRSKVSYQNFNHDPPPGGRL